MSKPIKTKKDLNTLKAPIKVVVNAAFKTEYAKVTDMNNRIKNLNNYIGKTQMIMYYKWLLQEGIISEDGAAVKRMEQLQSENTRKSILRSKHIDKATRTILLHNLDKKGAGNAKTSAWRNKTRQE